MNQPGIHGKEKRSDIQFLRGYAVLLVVIYHAGLHLLPGGFIGVDIFFVISGFLITGIIRRDLQNQNFSLSAFYVRRAKRLLPAAYVTLLLTVLLAPVLLTSTEFLDYRKQLFGALTFSANYVLKNQTGYFDGAADLKPLLHTWSLSVEEQFYFLIPTLLLIIPARVHRAFFILLFVLSLGGCFMAKANPETIFYTLPYRAWELALGAIAQYLERNRALRTKTSAHAWMPWLFLIVLPLIPMISLYPIYAALIASFSTAWLLVVQASMPTVRLTRWMTSMGNISYSVYLIHWPLFAYFTNVLIAPDPAAPWIRMGLMGLSFYLASALYRWIEVPCIKSSMTGSKVLTLSLVGAAVLIGTLELEMRYSRTEDRSEARNPSIGLNKACTTSGPMDGAHCRNNASPQYLIWGDSMAMHLVNGIAASRDPQVPLIQATRHACAPLIGMADYRNKADRRYQWEASCITFNDQVMEFLKKDTSVRTVILSGNLFNYLKPERLLVYRSKINGDLWHDESHSTDVFEALKTTVEGIRAMGRRVIFITPPPRANFDVSRCLERRKRSLLTLGGDPECRINQVFLERENLKLNLFLNRVQSELKVTIVSFEDTLCDGRMCKTTLDGIPLYRDDSHFSDFGGKTLIEHMKLMDQIDHWAK